MDNDQLKELNARYPQMVAQEHERSGYALMEGAIRAAKAEAEKMQLSSLPQGLSSSTDYWERVARAKEKQAIQLSKELAAERRHFQQVYEKEGSTACYPAGTIIIEPGGKLPEELMTRIEHVKITRGLRGQIDDLKRKYDLQNEQADRWHDTYQMMEADLGKVRAAIGDHAFDRIVDK